MDVTLRLRSGEPVHYGEALELVLSMHDEELWDYEREALEYVRDVLPHLRFYDVASIGIESDTIGVLYGFQAFSEDQREVLGGAPPFSKCRNVSLSIPELYSHVHLLEITEIFPALENLRFYASDLAHPTFVEHIEDGMVQPPSMEEVLDGPKLRIEMVQPDGETLVYGRFDDPPAAGLVDFGGGPPAP